jgi:hypothetical protein
VRTIPVLLLILTGCSTPLAGLEGVQHVAPSPAPDDSAVGVPGLPDNDTTFSPSNQPTTQGGRYYGYN